MDCENDFRMLLHVVAEGLTEDNVKMIKYLCKDIIFFNNDSLTCMNLFDSFENKGLINSSDLTFLAEVLYRIHRHDLLKKLPGVKNRKDYEQNFLMNQTHQNFTPFRIACFKLTGELHSSDFLILKNFCRNHMSPRNYHKSNDIFALLDCLEQEDLLSDGDLEFLLNSLRQLDNQAPFKLFEQLSYGDHSFIFPRIQPAYVKPVYEPFHSLPNVNKPLSSGYPLSNPNQFNSLPLIQPSLNPFNTGIKYQQAIPTDQSSKKSVNNQKVLYFNPGEPSGNCDGTAYRTFTENEYESSKASMQPLDSCTKSFMQMEPSEVSKPYTTAVTTSVNETDSTSLKQTYSTGGSTLSAPPTSQSDNLSSDKATMDSLDSAYLCPVDSSHPGFSRTPHNSSDFYQSCNVSDGISLVSQRLNLIKDSKDSIERYSMSSTPAGLCLIINNAIFEGAVNIAEAERRKKMTGHDYPIPNVGLKNRIGSEFDVDKVSTLFGDFGFEVVLHENLDSRAMRNVLVSTARKDHSRYDCFVLIIMSHGALGSVYGVDGMSVSCADIKSYFKPNSARTLLNKPKIFIYQACQGEQSMDGHVAPIDDIESDGLPEAHQSTPSESDFLILYSTVPGFISYRSRSAGSFFIKSVVDNLRKLHRVEDVLSIMTNVNAELARERLKQMAMPVSTLRKKVFFRANR